MYAPDGGGRSVGSWTAAAGSRVNWDVALFRGAEIRGRLRVADGKPLAGWKVRALAPASAVGSMTPWDRERQRFKVVTTNEQGLFRLSNRLASVYRLEVMPDIPRYEIPSLVVDTIIPGGDELDLRVSMEASPSSFVRGNLVSKGRPYRQGKIKMVAVGAPFSRVEVELDGGGSFSIGPVPSGDYILLCTSPVVGMFALDPVALSMGEKLDLGVVTVGEFGSFRAELVHENNDPFDRPELRVFGSSAEIVMSCQFDGRSATRSFLAPGRYSFCVGGFGQTAIGIDAIPFEIRPGETTTASITLHAGTKVRIVCKESPEVPDFARVAFLEIQDEDENFLWIRKSERDEDGLFVYQLYLTGEWEVRQLTG